MKITHEKQIDSIKQSSFNNKKDLVKEKVNLPSGNDNSS